MEAEQKVVHQRAKGHVVKQIGQHRPHFGRLILSQALLIKTVYLCRLSTLVVSTQKGDVIRVTKLQQNHQKDCLQAIVPTVHKVSQKQIVDIGTIPTHFKEFDQIVELTVNISANLCSDFILSLTVIGVCK